MSRTGKPSLKVVAAPNGFKGSLSAAEAARAMAAGIRRTLPGTAVVQVPVADGGDGLVAVALAALGGEPVRVTVADPLGRPVQAEICHVPARSLAAVEMALASGLTLLAPAERDPSRTSTLGTGELIRAALDLGVGEIFVGLGGSATNDGGLGMARALGARFFDERGNELAGCGADLSRLARIDLSGLDPRVRRCRIRAVCDVDNPLYGPRGAAHVYAAQKGADADMIRKLDQGLRNLARVIENDLGIVVADRPGAGAAGGLGAGMVAFVGASLEPGIELVLEMVGLADRLDGADLVLTGEGRLDSQTGAGKAPAGVARIARERGIPCIAVCGAVAGEPEDLRAMGIEAAFSLCDGPLSVEEAIRDGARLLARVSGEVARVFLAGRHPARDTAAFPGSA